MSFASAWASPSAVFTTPIYPFGLSPSNPLDFASSSESAKRGCVPPTHASSTPAAIAIRYLCISPSASLLKQPAVLRQHLVQIFVHLHPDLMIDLHIEIDRDGLVRHELHLGGTGTHQQRRQHPQECLYPHSPSTHNPSRHAGLLEL